MGVSMLTTHDSLCLYMLHFEVLCLDVQATTLFLQMLYNGWFKSQFTEELMKHYPLMVDDVVGKVMKHSQHEGVITECKALDSTLDRGL
jgi:hypothetical protein